MSTQKSSKSKYNYVRPTYFSPADVAVILQVSLQTVRRWIREGQLPAIKLGGENSRIVRIHRDDLEAFIRETSQRNASASSSPKRLE